MSRIGKLPVAIPAGVTVTVDGDNVVVLLAVMVPLTLGRHTTESLGMFLAFTMILMIVVLILANTWAKKKKK